jgi:hypothetical protein
MGKIRGLLMIVKIETVVLTGRLNANLNITKDMIDATSVDSAGIKAYESGEYGATFDFNSLYDPSGTMSFSEILAALKLTTSATIYFGETAWSTTGSSYFSAEAHFNAASLSADKNDVAKVAGSLTITGDISETALTSS